MRLSETKAFLRETSTSWSETTAILCGTETSWGETTALLSERVINIRTRTVKADHRKRSLPSLQTLKYIMDKRYPY
jgi:hypothetical protein